MLESGSGLSPSPAYSVGVCVPINLGVACTNYFRKLAVVVTAAHLYFLMHQPDENANFRISLYENISVAVWCCA